MFILVGKLKRNGFPQLKVVRENQHLRPYHSLLHQESTTTSTCGDPDPTSSTNCSTKCDSNKIGDMTYSENCMYEEMDGKATPVTYVLKEDRDSTHHNDLPSSEICKPECNFKTGDVPNYNSAVHSDGDNDTLEEVESAHSPVSSEDHQEIDKVLAEETNKNDEGIIFGGTTACIAEANTRKYFATTCLMCPNRTFKFLGKRELESHLRTHTYKRPFFLQIVR